MERGRSATIVGLKNMRNEQVARRYPLPAEALASIILFVLVFVVLAGAVMTGHLPLPHV